MISKFLRGGEVGRDLTNFSALYKKRRYEKNMFSRDNVIRVLLAGVRGPGKQGNEAGCVATSAVSQLEWFLRRCIRRLQIWSHRSRS